MLFCGANKRTTGWPQVNWLMWSACAMRCSSNVQKGSWRFPGIPDDWDQLSDQATGCSLGGLPNHSTTPHDHTGRSLPCTRHKLRTKLKTGTSASLLLYWEPQTFPQPKPVAKLTLRRVPRLCLVTMTIWSAGCWLKFFPIHFWTQQSLSTLSMLQKLPFRYNSNLKVDCLGHIRSFCLLIFPKQTPGTLVQTKVFLFFECTDFIPGVSKKVPGFLVDDDDCFYYYKK